MHMKKSIIFIISSLLLGAVASAQPHKVIEKEFERFSAVNVQDKFVVKLMNSDRYAVRVNVDERIAAHVQAYEKNGTLYLVLDERGYTKELKKELKKKGAVQPTLEVEIYMPMIKSLIFKDEVLVKHSDNLRSDDFTLTATDDVNIQQLRVSCSSAEMDISRSAVVSADFEVGNTLTLAAENSSTVFLEQKGGVAVLDLSGSSNVDLKATVQAVEVKASSGSESHISGTASSLTVDAAGYSRTDAELLEVREGYMIQSGSSKCHVNIYDKMKVNLTGGAMLTFKRTPAIEVERIVNSTLIKADDPKRK